MARFGTIPPSPELVPTKEAAKIYGCSPEHHPSVMREHGVEPVRTYAPSGQTISTWHPAVVLQVRQAHKLAKRERRAQREAPATHSRLLMRHRRLERERNKRLAPIAAKRGITVAKLRVDLGIDKG